jgi:hypothetical protein
MYLLGYRIVRRWDSEMKPDTKPTEARYRIIYIRKDANGLEYKDFCVKSLKGPATGPGVFECEMLPASE